MSRELIVTRETHELNILRRPRIRDKAFCDTCHRHVRWLIPDEAMLMAKTSVREIFRSVEKGECHYIESADGFLLVCAESLETAQQKERNPLLGRNDYEDQQI